MKFKLSFIKNVPINGDFIKLDSLLKHLSAAATGGEAKFYILSGQVFVNGEICLQRGKKLRCGDIIRFCDNIWRITGGC